MYIPSNRIVRCETFAYITVRTAPTAIASSVSVGVKPRRVCPANASTSNMRQIAATRYISGIAGAILCQVMIVSGMFEPVVRMSLERNLAGDRLVHQVMDRRLHDLQQRRRPDADQQHGHCQHRQDSKLASVQVGERGHL